MFPFDYIYSFLRSIFLIFVQPAEMEKNKQKVYVKWPSSMVPVYVEKDWTVQDLKANFGKKINTDPKKVRIIFAGKELHDEVRLLDCDVGEMTVVHAVPSRVSNNGTSIETPITNITSKLCDQEYLQSSGSEANKPPRSHFFVYCNSPCKSVTPGKLRVRCSKCKEGTLTVSRDPSSWDDVLSSNKIEGLCQAENCDGTIAEFYFKCAKHATNPDDFAVALFHIKHNFKLVPCIACTDVSQIVLIFPCKDGHVICLECFELYCISCLNDRRFIQDECFGYTLNCPAGCANSFIAEPHHFKLLGEEQYSKYQLFGAEECLLQAGGILCPRPDCGAGILPDDDCRRIICIQRGTAGCGFIFCRLCRESYHEGPCNEKSSNSSFNVNFSCDITDERAASSKWDDESRNTIQATTKPCPQCFTPTERAGGCMHMVCTRPQCGFQWCWVCQVEWTRDCMGNHWFG